MAGYWRLRSERDRAVCDNELLSQPLDGRRATGGGGRRAEVRAKGSPSSENSEKSAASERLRAWPRHTAPRDDVGRRPLCSQCHAVVRRFVIVSAAIVTCVVPRYRPTMTPAASH